VHDSTQGKAAIYAMTKADTPFGPYNNEQAVFLWFNEYGQINKIEELFDSLSMDGFLPKFHDYIAQST
jgi:hypothetical protein